MTNRTTPVDNAKVDESTLTQEDWDRAEGAHERFKDLLETKPRAKARYDAVLAEINERQATLRRLREARALTQSTLAELLEMDQSEISRLERRSDMLLSTLKRFVHANGGELPLVVRSPDSAPVELVVGDECPAGKERGRSSVGRPPVHLVVGSRRRYGARYRIAVTPSARTRGAG